MPHGHMRNPILLFRALASVGSGACHISPVWFLRTTMRFVIIRCLVCFLLTET